MPAPVPHHHALGIHPGAFVQPTEPSTADVQDGVLWLDTSAGPPHQLKRWHAASSAWQPVQMDATGYPLPSGHRIEDYRIGALPNPLDPPVLVAVTRGSTCGVPAGEYWLVYTLGDGIEETLPSPPAAVTTVSGQWINASVPSTLDPGTLPDNVWIKYYIVAPLPSDGLYAGFVDEHYYQAIDSNLYAVTHICTALDHSRPLPPSINNTGTAGFRILDPSGALLLTHDGSTATHFVDNVPVLEAPLPLLARTPATLVGQDPVSGLPSFCPPPNPRTALVAEQQDIERPNPAGPLTCVQVKCGVATALRDELYATYGTMRSIINSGVNTLGGALGGLLVDTGTAFFVALTDGLDIELAVPIRNALDLVIKAVPGITGSVLQAGFADLNTDQKQWLRQTCWCALLCEANQVTLTEQMMQDWQTVVAADTVMLSGVQRDALAALIQHGAGVGLSKWAQVAQTGAGFPSHDCDAYSCP